MANCKMFGGLFKPKFYTKCKASIKLTKMRLEIINRKRAAVMNILKKDIADLLENSHDSNAYGRVEGLMIEQNITRCYKLMEDFCTCVLDHLSYMSKQSECPEECREAVASLAFAAARFADLPELRDLRSRLYQKYGKSIDNFVNKEFSSRLMIPEHPSKETKVQWMRDIADEFSIEWDSKALEQKLFTPPENYQKSAADETEEGEEKQTPNPLPENKFGLGRKHKANDIQNVFLSSSDSSSQWKTSIDVEDQIPFTENEEKKKNPSLLHKEEEEVEKKKSPNSYQHIPPPYRKEPKLDYNSKPKPRSVRQRRPRPLTETSSSDGEEKFLKPPYQAVEETTSSWWWKGSEKKEDQMKGHHRSSSLAQSEILGGGHVHPKLPEYEELAARIEKLRSGET